MLFIKLYDMFLFDCTESPGESVVFLYPPLSEGRKGHLFLFYYCQYVALTHHQVFLSFTFQFCAGILPIEDFIANLENHFLILGTVADGNNFATLWLFLGCIWDDNTTNFFFCLCRKHEDSVCSRVTCNNQYIFSSNLSFLSY